MSKQIFKVDIEPEVADAIRRTFERRKIGYAAGTETIFRWFTSIPEELQAAILGQLPESIQPDVARIVLERMAEAPSKPRIRSAAEGRSPKRGPTRE